MLRNGFFAADAALAVWSLGRALELSVAVRIERFIVETGISYPRSLDEADWDFTLGDVTWDRVGGVYGFTLLGIQFYVNVDPAQDDE